MSQLAEKGWLRSFIVFYFLFLFRQLSRVFLWPWFLFSISMNPLQIPTERMQDLQINMRISSIWIWGNMSKWVFPKIGGNPPKWMVYFMENPLLNWMIWGVFPYFWFNTQMSKCLLRSVWECFFRQEIFLQKQQFFWTHEVRESHLEPWRWASVFFVQNG